MRARHRALLRLPTATPHAVAIARPSQDRVHMGVSGGSGVYLDAGREDLLLSRLLGEDRGLLVDRVILGGRDRATAGTREQPQCTRQ